MNDMIIHKIYSKKIPDGGGERLCAKIQIENTQFEAWYETIPEYADSFCTERCDAFVVNFLLYAMEHHYDIQCETDMTERLYYQLTEYLIPSIAANIDRYKAINIHAHLAGDKMPCIGAVGTGLSGGVDSFYTILKHLNREEKSYNLTHVLFCNAGTNGDYGGKKAKQLFHDRMTLLEDVSKQMGLKVVPLDTNINEILQQKQEMTVTFRTLSSVLALQKLFGTYYFASGFPFAEFMFAEQSTEFYDLLILQCISTENVCFYSSGGETSRMGKLKYISDNSMVQQHLNVCVNTLQNCGKCSKCRRTMLELYCLGKLDDFRNVFDVDYFYAHINDYKKWVLRYPDSPDMPELHHALAEQKEFPVWMLVFETVRLILKKIYVFAFGKSSTH